MELTLRAMSRCMEYCSFGDVFLATDLDVEVPFRIEKIEPLRSRTDYCEFVLKNLGRCSDVPFFLLVQWDGYILNPELWTAEFLEFDYIGAKWRGRQDGMSVGNSGFCLRSKKLLDVLASPEIPPSGGEPDDVYICRTLRRTLESDYDIRFAPEPVADLFAYEHTIPDRPTFGFHGLANMWRHVDDDEMADIAGRCADYVAACGQYVDAIKWLFAMRKFNVLRAYYARLLKIFATTENVHRHLANLFDDQSMMTDCVRVCDEMVLNFPDEWSRRSPGHYPLTFGR
jgi:hypothetical protein